MNQTSIIKELIIAYQLEGGNPADIAAVVVYVTAKKPAGIGRVNEVIVRAILKQLGVTIAKSQPMTEVPPPAIVETAPIVVDTSSLVSVDPVAAYDFGEPTLPPMVVPSDAEPVVPLKAPDKADITPEAVPVEVAPNAQAPKGFWSKVRSKFWK
jgi:hypothetical protein